MHDNVGKLVYIKIENSLGIPESSGEDSELSTYHRGLGWILIGELRSHKPYGMAKE